MKYDLELDININTSHALMLQRIKKRSRVLEFGSASGYMTRYLKEELECEVTCVEIDKEAAQKAEVYAHLMIVADLEMLENWVGKLEGKYDYILFADVLEHLRNPKKVLETAVSFLETDGIVMTSVPNISHNAIIMELLHGKFDYQPTGLLDDTHVHFFTRKSVFEMLESCDLKVVEWLSTMRKPDSTEFEQSYDHFPIALSNYLKSRKDGDVYQYITISQKTESVSVEQVVNYDEENNGNYLDMDHCQVYLEQQGEYKEEHSLLHSIKMDNQYKTYTFLIPSEHEGNIRIDPCNDMAIIDIKSIRLLKNDGNVYFESNPQNDFSGITELNHLYKFDKSAVLTVLSLNQDPNLILKEIGNTYKNELKLEIEMKMTNNMEYILNVLTEKINNAKQEVNVNEKIIVEKENVISINQLTIKELEKNIIDFEVEISRKKIDLENLEEKYKLIEKKYNLTEKTLNELLNSKSWRLTAIFRKLFSNLKS